jgi:protein phosphatase
MKYAKLTHTGARESNQDRVFAGKISLFGKPAVLLAVADGMGGMQAGDKAAEIAIETVQKYGADVLPSLPDDQQRLSAALIGMYQEANRKIWEFGQANGCGGMGTTLVVCVATGGKYLVANAGDSRCFYVNNHGVVQVTEDHSRVQELVRKGSMTAEAARRSPYRNQLTNSLGEPHEIQVDLFPEGGRWGIIDEDCVFLLCSDGLHGEVSEQDIHAQLSGTKNIEDACANLVSLAYLNGSTDNITVAAAEFGALKRAAKLIPRMPPVEELKQRPAEDESRPPVAAAPPKRKTGRLGLAAVLCLIVALVFAGWYIARKPQDQAVSPAAKAPGKTRQNPGKPDSGKKKESGETVPAPGPVEGSADVDEKNPAETTATPPPEAPAK